MGDDVIGCATVDDTLCIPGRAVTMVIQSSNTRAHTAHFCAIKNAFLGH